MDAQQHRNQHAGKTSLLEVGAIASKNTTPAYVNERNAPAYLHKSVQPDEPSSVIQLEENYFDHL